MLGFIEVLWAFLNNERIGWYSQNTDFFIPFYYLLFTALFNILMYVA